MTERIISILNENGEETRYKRYSARLPAFLKEYNPKDGFRVLIERTDLLSQKKGLLSLLREAIVAGRKLSDPGLPGIERDIHTIVCNAKLLGPGGDVLREAAAAMEVLERKDYEALETAADQRLLARCGFGGEVFDDEEDGDIRAQGHAIESAGQDPQMPTAASREIASSSRHESASASPGDPEPKDDETEVTEAERRQVENLARRVGEPIPTLKTRADVKAERSRLGGLDRQRRSATARPAEAQS